MRLSDKQIKDLQALLLEMTGIEYSPEKAQSAGLAIVRFIYAKEHRKNQFSHKENISYGTNEE